MAYLKLESSTAFEEVLLNNWLLTRYLKTGVFHIYTLNNLFHWKTKLTDMSEMSTLPMHPAGTSISSVKYDKPVHSASNYGQWGHFFLACGETNSVENPWISQSSLDLFPKWLDI